MPGPIDIDPSTIRPKSNIAYKDTLGRWRAGPDAKRGYSQGDMIRKEDYRYVETARNIRRRTNLVKGIMRAGDHSETEARDRAEDMVRELAEAETDEERKEIWEKYGY